MSFSFLSCSFTFPLPNWLEIIQYFQESDMTTCQAAELNKRIEFEGLKKAQTIPITKKNQGPPNS